MTEPANQDRATDGEAAKQRAAERALDDPAALERAARIIRVALARHRQRLAETEPDPDA